MTIKARGIADATDEQIVWFLGVIDPAGHEQHAALDAQSRRALALRLATVARNAIVRPKRLSRSIANPTGESR